MLKYGWLKRRRKQTKYCAALGRTIAVLSDPTNTAYSLQNSISLGRIEPAAVRKIWNVQMNEYTYYMPCDQTEGETAKACRKQYWNRNNKESAELQKSKDCFQSSQFWNQRWFTAPADLVLSTSSLLSLKGGVWAQTAFQCLPPLSTALAVWATYRDKKHSSQSFPDPYKDLHWS